jgi:hypothetical protein
VFAQRYGRHLIVEVEGELEHFNPSLAEKLATWLRANANERKTLRLTPSA